MAKKSLLWKITHPEGKMPSYLFGTMHVKDQLAFAYMQRIEQLLKEVGRLYMEIDLSIAADASNQQQFYLPEQKQLADYLGAKKYLKYRDIILKAFKFDIEPNRFLRPILLTNAIAESLLQEDHKLTLDQHIYSTAQGLGIPSYGLESINYHYEILGKVPLDKQFAQLKNITRNPSKFRKQILKLTELYQVADLHALYIMSKDSMAEIKKIMLYERNELMLTNMISAMTQDSCLFAVGAAHLGGNNGLIRLLRKNGYQVKAEV